jgi:hypothetical protein
MDAIAASRVDFAGTLASLGFLPSWYVPEMRASGAAKPGANSSSGSGSGRCSGGAGNPPADCGIGGAATAEAYGAMAAMAGGPDEFSSNSRMIKAALCAGAWVCCLLVRAAFPDSRQGTPTPQGARH